jgi:hypothetical protein
MILGSGVGHLPPIGGGGLDGEVTLLAQAGGPALGSGGEHAWGGGALLQFSDPWRGSRDLVHLLSPPLDV